MPSKARSFGELAHSPVPFGIGEIKPHHYLDMLRVIWQNRDNLGYAWRVLTKGVCDGCALGTSGLRDWTIEGTHLCMVRLELLRLNTMGALEPSLLSDVSRLEGKTSKELLEMGRLGYPMRMHDFRRSAATTIAELRPDLARIIGHFLGHSRQHTSEVYYNKAQMLVSVRRHTATVMARKNELRHIDSAPL